MAEKYLMNTLDQTFARAKEENIGVSKNFIRQALISGALPCVQVGKKRLVNWNQFLEFLETPQQVCKPELVVTGEIRPVPENLKRG